MATLECEKFCFHESRDLRWSRCEFLNDYSAIYKVNRNIYRGNCLFGLSLLNAHLVTRVRICHLASFTELMKNNFRGNCLNGCAGWHLKKNFVQAKVPPVGLDCALMTWTGEWRVAIGRKCRNLHKPIRFQWNWTFRRVCLGVNDDISVNWGHEVVSRWLFFIWFAKEKMFVSVWPAGKNSALTWWMDCGFCLLTFGVLDTLVEWWPEWMKTWGEWGERACVCQ